ncbi:MAG: PAS domain S-box protein, partial [Rectinema sp.]|nr:PAS domain S-box protein [Rectinema sp.]
MALGILDSQSTIEWVNRAWEDLTGWKRKELLGMNLGAILEHESEKNCESMLEMLSGPGSAHSCDAIRKRKDGDWYHESMEVVLLEKDKTREKKYLVIRRDITAQILKRLELEIGAELALALKRCRQPESAFSTAADILKKYLPVSKLGFVRLDARQIAVPPWFGDRVEKPPIHLSGTECLVHVKNLPYALCAVEWAPPFVPGYDLILLSALETLEPVLSEIEAEKASHELIDRLALLDMFKNAANSNLPLEQAMAPILTQIREILQADALAFYIPENEDTVTCIAFDGFRTNLTLGARIAKGEIFVGLAWKEKRVVEVHNLAEASREIPQFHEMVLAEGFMSQCCIPVILFGEFKGLLEFLFRHDFTPDQSWLAFGHAAAYQIGILIEVQGYLRRLEQSYGELETANESIIEGLSSALEFRDQETEGHTQRVTSLFMTFAGRFFREEHELKRLRIGSLLHDIGKIGVPDAILNKPGPLTPEERSIMQKHPLISKEILSRIPSLSDCMDIPLYHHEKFDGTGYPFGLKGSDLSLIHI